VKVVEEDRPIVTDDPFVQIEVELSPTHSVFVEHQLQFQFELNLGQIVQILGVKVYVNTKEDNLVEL